ncbi:MAG: PleD family two-component system response regulator [Alphaproteobacteria bacterium]|nr:MAG: PleD family two-component system response regulator [Alphaproteobacteria bacterium]
MSARILVVDDVLANVKLLEAKLSAEYFEVLTALNGPDALKIVKEEDPDLVLLDVMMPGMDGFEVCRTIKGNPETEHIPVVMVTALDQPSDRVAGIEAGADDFLTKPVNDIALMARVKSLVRLKTMTDEMRMREATGRTLGILAGGSKEADAAPGRILLVEERAVTAKRVADTLGSTHEVFVEQTQEGALDAARQGEFDLIIVSLSIQGFDGMRLCSHLRTLESTRNVPLLALIEDGDMPKLARALELGVNDYLMRPIDRNELFARVKTQLKRKRYADRLRENFHLSLEMAITCPLTGLYNRRYMTGHLETLLEKSKVSKRNLSFLIIDIDFFKQVNDTYGHDVGDEVLKEFASRLAHNTRGVDLACRYGGEEFVVVMPDSNLDGAIPVAERLRLEVEAKPFAIRNGTDKIDITVSIGVAESRGEEDAVDALLRRADQALYRAKQEGRNRVVTAAAA